jgi:putative membrane protein
MKSTWHDGFMRMLLRFLFSAVGLLTASALIPGIKHGVFLELLAVAIILGALNATLGSLLKFIAFIPMACSFGCFSLVINGLVFWLAGAVSARLGLGFSVSGFWAGFFGALITSLITWILERVLLGPEERSPKHPKPRKVKVVN